MSHTIIYNPDMHIIEIKVEGVVQASEMKEIFAEAVRIGIEKDTFLFLSDFQEATIELTVIQIYDLPKMLSNVTAPMGVSADRLRRAIVFSPKTFSDARFAENVTLNQGQFAKFFQDIDAAKKWLSE